MEVDAADSFRINAYRRAAARIRETPASVAQLALDGKAKGLQGIGKTIEGKIVEVVDDGEMHALTKRKAEVPPEVATFMRLPGLGPKTARRIWQELGITTVGDAQGGRRGGRAARATRASARAPSRRSRRRSPSRGPPRGRAGRCSARRCRGCAPRSSRARPSIRRRSRSRLQARPGACARPCATSTSSRRPPTRRRSSTISAPCRGSSTSPPRARRRRPSSRTTGLRFDLRVVAAGELRQPAPALHRLEAPQRRAPRGRGSARALDLRVLRDRRRDRRGAQLRDRGRGLRVPRVRLDPARAARERRRARGRARRASCRTSSRSATCAATSTPTRRGRTARTRSRRWSLGAQERGYDYYAICDHSHRLRGDLLKQQSEQIDELNDAVAPFRILKGIEVNIRPDGALDVSDEDLATRDWVVASVHSASTTTRPSGFWPRWRARTSTASGTDEPEDRQAVAVGADRPRSRARRGRSRRARSSRSTPSPIDSISPTCTSARRARPASRS